MPPSDFGNQAAPAAVPDGPNTAGIHPDRLKHMGPQSMGPNIPSGPRSSAPSTRPPRPNDRPRDGNRSQMQQLQHHLQSSTQGTSDQGSEGTPIRGRGANRQPNANAPSTPPETRSELFPEDGQAARPGPGGDRREDGPRQLRGGRRGDLMDESSEQRRPPRTSTSRTHSSERGDRTSEQGREREKNRDREKERDRERETHRRHEDDSFRPPSTRKEDHRERHRNFDRERDRPRGRDHERERERDRARDVPPDTLAAGSPGGGGGGQGGRGGDPMRRGEPSSGVNREAISSGRGRRDTFDRNKDRGGGAGPMNDPNALPLPPGGGRPDERPRDRESHRPRDRERGDRERDHPRERDREGERERPRDRDRNRDRDRDMDNAHPPPNVSGNWQRKRNRPSSAMEGGPDGPGPARFGHDNKRPRRAH
ncbi:hypothetical protein KEM56_003249 [Ascosphaera pollenicola]|nr:hypothetical protein KEM56_003249 [Ascosphaera pollenicola]